MAALVSLRSLSRGRAPRPRAAASAEAPASPTCTLTSWRLATAGSAPAPSPSASRCTPSWAAALAEVSMRLSSSSAGSTEPSVPSNARSAAVRPVLSQVASFASRSSLQLRSPALRHNAAAASGSVLSCCSSACLSSRSSRYARYARSSAACTASIAASLAEMPSRSSRSGQGGAAGVGDLGVDEVEPLELRQPSSRRRRRTCRRRSHEGGEALVAERIAPQNENYQRGQPPQGRREGHQPRVADGSVAQLEVVEPRQGASAQGGGESRGARVTDIHTGKSEPCHGRQCARAQPLRQPLHAVGAGCTPTERYAAVDEAQRLERWQHRAQRAQQRQIGGGEAFVLPPDLLRLAQLLAAPHAHLEA
eukprot:scaffold35338_cov59-Phaeocystis_antarctica.AAC.8